MVCANHPEKKGKYHIKDEKIDSVSTKFYCSKCAIYLTSQNLKMVENEKSLNKSDLQ